MNGRRDVPASWMPESDDDCGGLSKTLELGKGSRVMLRRNISVVEGLVNGVCGTIVDFEWTNGDAPMSPGELPVSVLVLFDDKRVGQLQQCRPYTTDTQQHAPGFSQFHGIGGSQKAKKQRKQLPLLLCWAATVHKVQGITLDRAVIDLKGIFSFAAAYVALSRVRSLEGVTLSGFNKKDKIFFALKHVLQEYDRLRVLTKSSFRLSISRLSLSYHVHLLLLVPNTSESLSSTSKRSATTGKKKEKLRAGEYLVERIVGKKILSDGAHYYYVKWFGYAASKKTLEPRDNLHSCLQMVNDFNQTLLDKHIQLQPAQSDFNLINGLNIYLFDKALV